MSFLFGSEAKTKNAWENAPGNVKQLVNDNSAGLVAISRDALKQYKDDKAKGYQQYTGDRVADFDPAEQAGLDMLMALPGQQAGIEGQINGLGGLDMTLAGNPDMIQALYNPYQQDVIDTTMSDLNRLQQQKQMQRNAAAGAAGNFGGSRAGVMDALAAGEESRANATTLAGLRKEGWDTASGLATKDLDRTASYNSNYMDVLRGLYGDMGTSTRSTADALAGIGATRRGIEQDELDVDYGDWQAKQQYPWQLMSTAQNILGRTNPATDAAAAPSTQTPGSAGLLDTVAGGISAGVGTWMACDERLKLDLERVATLPSGAGWFTFRYVWDEPGIRRQGPVAQDLARFVPEAVAMGDDGYLMVDANRIG